jgi:hypothetical protein
LSDDFSSSGPTILNGKTLKGRKKATACPGHSKSIYVCVHGRAGETQSHGDLSEASLSKLFGTNKKALCLRD